MQTMSTHELAPMAARQFGADYRTTNGVTCVGNGVTQQELDEMIAELVAEGNKPSAIDFKALALLQTEGHGNV
jgi:hypothetical protein